MPADNTPDAASGILRMVIIAFLVLLFGGVLVLLFFGVCILRWWGSLKSFLLVPQAIQFNPQLPNLRVQAKLIFRYRRLRPVRFAIVQQRPICSLLCISGVPILIHC